MKDDTIEHLGWIARALGWSKAKLAKEWPAMRVCACSRCLGEFLRGLVQQQTRTLMNTLDELLELIRSNTTMIEGLNTLLDGLRVQVQAILNGEAVSPVTQAKVDAAFAAAIEQRARIAETLAENTPATPPAPPSPN